MLEEMPLTANGKIDRKRLPAVGSAGREAGTEYVAPRTPVEEALAGIYEDLLKLERIGVHDNFFELGGHSLLATQVVSQVTNTFDAEIGVRSIFEAATVAKLAELLIARERKPGQTEKVAAILLKLRRMTDAEAGAELAERER
jgi:acyl carrier protein